MKVMLNDFIEYIGLYLFYPTCNLCVVKMKQVRKQLEQRLGMNLGNKTVLIKKLFKEFLIKKNEINHKKSEPHKKFPVETKVSLCHCSSSCLYLCLNFCSQLNAERAYNINLFYVVY